MLHKDISSLYSQDELEINLQVTKEHDLTQEKDIFVSEQEIVDSANVSSHIKLAHNLQSAISNAESLHETMEFVKRAEQSIAIKDQAQGIKAHSADCLSAIVKETLGQMAYAKAIIAAEEQAKAERKAMSFHHSDKQAQAPSFNSEREDTPSATSNANQESSLNIQTLLNNNLLPPKYAMLSSVVTLGVPSGIAQSASRADKFIYYPRELQIVSQNQSSLDKAHRSSFPLYEFLADAEQLSFTHCLPPAAFQGMHEVLNSRHHTVLAAQCARNLDQYIPPVPAALSYEQVLTPETYESTSVDLYFLPDELDSLFLSAHADESAEQIIAKSYHSQEKLKQRMSIWRSYASHFVHNIFHNEQDLAVTNEVHKTLNYVIHHHEKFKHDNNPELLTCIGRWCFDRVDGGFYIDKGGAKLFGLKEGQAKLTIDDLYRVFDKSHVDRIIRNQNNPDTGNIVSDRLLLISGPYAGKFLTAQGAVVIRDPVTNQALFSSGILCYEYCPNADFLCREILGDGMFIWDMNNDQIIVSPSYHLMLGYTKDEFPTKTEEFARMLVHPDDDDALRIQHMIVRSPAYGNSFESCIRLKHKSGKYIWTIGRGVVLERNSKGVATKIIGSQTDIDLVHKSFENIGELMFTDSLTELHNRSYFTQNAIRFDGSKVMPMSILFVDVTGLKLTNDILGHNFGDYLILKCAIALLQAIQNFLGHFNLWPDFKEGMNETIDHLTHKAFAQIFQNKELLDKAETVASKNNSDFRRSNSMMHFSTVPRLTGANESAPRVIDLNPDEIDTLLQQKMKPEVLRLSGDELLILFPSCTLELALQLEKECLFTARKMNAIDKLSFPIEQRPTPLCFGIGTATVGELGEGDSFKQALERADMRMLQNKEENQKEHHKILQEYFEQRLKRKVSMRDSRRSEILSEAERQKLREQNLAKQKSSTAHSEMVTIPPTSLLRRDNIAEA